VKTNIILFLNKYDIFLQKVKAGKSIKICYEEYTGQETPEASLEYMTKDLINIVDPVTGQKRKITTHTTTATSTQNIQVVWESIHEYMLNAALMASGF